MIITKKAIPRRLVLRGLGTAVALPLLDSMVPAMTALAKTPAAPVRRLTVIYVAHGVAPGYFLPTTEGPAYELTPILKPLAPFQDRALLLTGIDNPVAQARDGEPRGGHGRMAPAFMSGVHAKPDDRGRLRSRDLDRPDCGESHRRGDPVGITRAVGGHAGIRRDVRFRVQLRVYQHDLLAHADDATADGAQPARRLRAPLRR